MAEGRKVALMYEYNENWIGGTYYIQNLIKAMQTLELEDQPPISIVTSSYASFEKLKEETGYSNLLFLSSSPTYSFFERGINKLSRIITGENSIHHFIKADVVFPLFSSYPKNLEKVERKLFWIPDFQEHYLPHFFSEVELQARKANQKWIIDNWHSVVLSSHSAKSDFNEIYPDNKCKQFVIPFAVTHPALNDELIYELIKQYDLPSSFYMCPNQFWKHKNHLLVLKAIVELKHKGKDVFVVFTGREHDYRNPEYYGELQNYILENDIQDNVKFLGFIDREHQLLLMKAAIAIIQPSLFEGWSTVIEDAKALNKLILASDLTVHKEQLTDKGYFFDKEDCGQLSELMVNFNGSKSMVKFNYKENIKHFARSFYELFYTNSNAFN